MRSKPCQERLKALVRGQLPPVRFQTLKWKSERLKNFHLRLSTRLESVKKLNLRRARKDFISWIHWNQRSSSTDRTNSQASQATYPTSRQRIISTNENSKRSGGSTKTRNSKRNEVTKKPSWCYTNGVKPEPEWKLRSNAGKNNWTLQPISKKLGASLGRIGSQRISKLMMIQRLLVIQLTNRSMVLKVVNNMTRLKAVWEVQTKGSTKMIQMIVMINQKRMMNPKKLGCLSTETTRRKRNNLENF